MAPPQVFIIELQDGNRAFFPGQTINGRVILHCQEQKTLRGIYLTLVGRAYVHWTEHYTSGTGDNQHPVTVHCREEEPYFNVRVNLWGGDGDSQQLPPGNYKWPFSFQLPCKGLPTSFEGYIGNIRYWLEAHMDRPWKFDHVTKCAFTVLEHVDLNLSQEDLNAPRRREGQRTLCCLCCKSGPLTLAVSTDRGAYCAGEKILLNARLENNTNREMRMLKATLRRKIMFYAEGSSREHCHNIVAETTGGIAAQQTFEWKQKPLSIPACLPSSHTCRIIHMDYSLDVEVVVPTFSSNLHVILPIVIGTVPLRSAYTNTTLPTVRIMKVEAVNVADNQYTMGQTQLVQMPPVGQFEGPPPPTYSPYSENQEDDPAPPYPG